MPKYRVIVREDVWVEIVIMADDDEILEQFLSSEMEGKVADLAASKLRSQVVEERYIRAKQLLSPDDARDVDHVV